MSFETLVPTSGFLVDRQIRQSLQEGYLLEQGTWQLEQVRHASYTLRVGEEVRIARATDANSSTSRQFSVYHLAEKSKEVDIYPGDTALLYSCERVRLPDCVLAFTVARGLLFVEALSPENTYVDPGFSGSLYTTITNVSNRVIRLEYGMPIARMFFYRLPVAPEAPYRSGASLGIDQQISSVRAVPIGTADECRTATTKELRTAIRQTPLTGLQLAESLLRLSNAVRSTRVGLATFALTWPILLLFAYESEFVRNNLGTFLGGVAASLVAAVLMIIVTKVWNVIRTDA